MPLPLSSTRAGHRLAGERDRDAIADLVNSAYRGDLSRQGWATEAGLLGGQRIDADEIADLIRAPDSILFLRPIGADIVACLHLSKVGEAAHLGPFAVRSSLQGHGFGRRLERTGRAESIAVYERLGFRGGRREPIPNDPRHGSSRRDPAQEIVPMAIADSLPASRMTDAHPRPSRLA